MIHSHCVFPSSPQLKLDAGSQESPLCEAEPDFLAKGPFSTSASPSANREDKKWCLTHRGDRRNYQLMWVKPLKMKGLYAHVNYNFYQPWSLCIPSCHSGLFCASPKQPAAAFHRLAPWVPLVASKSRRLDSELRLASPLWAAQVSPLLIPEGKSKPTTWAGKIR